ncbi:hypothetical protein [Novosphingobium sp. PY1]|uniref:hypothetical protein n=1 Tax=Novosphingobium sp. PY1 TaxID=1882221 RepID=UPI001A8F6712|nr:hypothetical protein [Novosphingobium sp. PY1]GFM28610.1 uncharacterized protein PY1_contig-05-4 [Novosphingobium sp. PY1]
MQFSLGSFPESFAAVSGHRLLNVSISPIERRVAVRRCPRGTLFIETDIHLRAQCALRRSFGQLRKDTATKLVVWRAEKVPEGLAILTLPEH